MFGFGLPRVILLCSLLMAAGCQTARVPTAEEPPPENADFLTANEYAKDGLLREAAQAYRTVLRKSPNHMAAHRNLGIVYVKAGEYKKASAHLEKCIDAFEDNYEANFYLAESYRAREKFGEAIFRYKKALKIKENDVRTMKALAWSYFKIRFYSEALRTIADLKKLSPEDTQISIIAARTLIKIGQDHKALSVIRKAQVVANKVDIPYLQSVEGDIYFRTNECEKALAVYREALKEQPLLAGALLGLGQCLLKTGAPADQAITYMERAVRLKPRLTEGFYALGKAYEKTDQNKSLRYYKQFRKQAAADPDFLSQLPEVKEKIDLLSKQGSSPN